MNFNVNGKAPVVLTSALVLAMSSMGALSFLNPKEKDNTNLIEKKNEVSYRNVLANATVNSNASYVYLSDIPYVADQSFVGWSKVTLDKNLDNGNLITLNIDGNKTQFLKGIVAHATSCVVYDLSQYNYDYFTAYIGVEASKGNNGNGVKFFIYTSNDGENWDLQTSSTPNVLKGSSNAEFVKVNIKGAKYLKLYADKNGNDGYDHATYANPKLIKEDYVEDTSPLSWIQPVSYYDNQLKNLDASQLLGDKELLVYQRDFVNKVGYDNLQMLAKFSEKNEAAIRWLFESKENLKLYLISGAPDGSYLASMQVLADLYESYKDDFTIQERTTYGYSTLGELYTKMAISLCLTHSTTSYFWMNGTGVAQTNSNAVNRYSIFKELYLSGRMRFTSTIDFAKWFEQYEMGEMRYVMNTIMDDDEMIWLNEYTQSFIDANPNNAMWYLSPHPYMSYTWPNYGRPEYYDEANKEKYDEKYKGIFSKYGVPYGEKGVARIWMNIEGGAVCGGISKQGASNRAAHGVPATVVSQPGHAAFAYYTMNDNGDGYWTLNNVIAGWEQSGKTERLHNRAPLGWGNDTYVSGWAASYILMAQEAMNHNDQYELSKKYYIIADMYKDDAVKREEYLRKSLEALPYNVDSWWALIQLYNNDSTKTEFDYYNLASELADALMPFPLPMQNLLDQLAGKFTSTEYVFKYNLLVINKLTEGKNLPNSATDKVMQPANTRAIASYLLGSFNTTLASFSFDGENAGKIVLGSHMNDMDVFWDYSLDGKNTWKDVYTNADDEHSWQLTKEEIDSITAENDIYIHIKGVNPEYNDTNTFKIDITSATYPTGLYANDYENKVIGANDTLQWKLSENDVWHNYIDEQPDLTGDKTVIFRVKSTGTRLASTTETYTFTADNQPDTEKYIPISRINVVSASSQQNNTDQAAKNAFDGNINTMWHSSWNGSDQARSIVVELDEPIYLSALEYYPRSDAENGRVRSAKISVSMDGENWTDVVNGTNWANDGTVKKVNIEILKQAKYVKFAANTNYGDGRNFISAMMINLFEDTTVSVAPTFSFDGENAGKIVLEGDNTQDLSWSYSLDGGNTWNNAHGSSHQLLSTELESISSENGIKISINDDSNEYNIPIQTSVSPTRVYANDLENRLIGVTNANKLEWKLANETEWKLFSEEEPIVKGNNTLQVRTKGTGLASPSDYIEYEFTDDNQDETMKYISINHLSIHEYSTQSVDANRPHYAPNAIDGNPNTEWHTDFRESIETNEAFITIKLDEPRYVSGLEYTHMDSKKESYGHLKSATVYVSEDGENWTQAGSIQDCPKDDEAKMISFDESVYGQYVKLVFNETHDNVFASAAMINLYEDSTKQSEKQQKIEVRYTNTNITNQDVVATVISDKDITITNNDGSASFVFTQNGVFTFEYIDSYGRVGSITATVSNIDKIAPTADIEYSVTNPTNQDVVATLTNISEEVTVINNNGSLSHTFTENGNFDFILRDAAGNETTITATVCNIDKIAPTVEIEYSTTELTNQNVIATLVNESEEIVILTENESKSHTFTENGEFTFFFEDIAGNKGSITAIVSNIDKTAPTADVEYSVTNPTNQDVVATLTNISEEVTVINNNGSLSHTFTENGNFEFIIRDAAGNRTTITATVSNIDKIAPTADIEYSVTNPTNQDVVATLTNISEEVTVINNNGSLSHTFTENGEFTFEFVDAAGNIGTKKAVVKNIDKTLPTINLEYSNTELTNQNVVVTLTSDRDITILNNNGEYSHTFTENGEFIFEVQDSVGNILKYKAEVNNIDKVSPTAELEYSTTQMTNQDVTVKLVNISEEVTILNNDGKTSYTFTENGDFTFKFQDKAGNIGTKTATVSNIDKIAPTADIIYSTLEATNQDVIVSLINISDDAVIVNNDGNPDYTFTENGTFEFILRDAAGNITKYPIVINNIFKTAPAATIKYSTLEATNEDVTVTIECDEEIIIVNNDGKTSYTFTNNGEFTFIYRDKLGNENKVIAKVDWIHKSAPIAKVSYSTEEEAEEVEVTISCDEEIIITNNDGKSSYVFKENGEFTFEYEDKFGNKGSITVYVDWIKKKEELPNTPSNPNVPSGPGEPNTPNVPNVPSDPSEPNTPDVPNVPSGPSEPDTPNVPSSPSEPNTPSQVTKPTTTKPTTTTKPSVTITNKPQNSNNKVTTTKKPNSTTTTKVEEKTHNYNTDGVSIEVQMNTKGTKYTLKKDKLELEDNLKEQIKGENEYFELYLENDASKKDYIEQTNPIITIEIDSNRKLANVFKVDNSGNLEEIEYEKVNRKQIKVKTQGLGKFIIVYEEEIEMPMTKEAKKNKNLLWYAIGTGVVIISGVAGTAYYKRKEDYR